MDASRVFARLREAGYSGVEMVGASRRECAREAGLELVNLAGPGMREGLNDVRTHSQLLPALRDSIREAEVEGIGQVIVFTGNRGDRSDTDGIAACVAGLTELAPVAEAAEVTLTLEVLNPIDHPDYHACRSEVALEIVRRVNSPWVKVLYDQYHMQRAGEDPYSIVAAHLSHIAHLHIAHAPGRTIPTAAEGEFIQSIRKSGYAGYVGLEFVVPPGTDPIEEYVSAAALFK